MTISERIFMLLKQKNISQKEFAERTGISQSTISDWKRKNTNPSADKILKICDVLKITPYELLSEDDTGETVSADYHMMLNKDERVLLDTFQTMNVRQRNRLLGYLDALTDK